MSTSFTLSPPCKCNLYTISYNPTLALQGSYTYSSTYTNSPISIHNKYISHNDTHTHHTPYTPTQPRIHPNTSHSHPPRTPTYIHYPKHPNLHPIPPQTQNTSLQHLQSFQPPPIYLLHSCTVTITLHQHMNNILNIRTLIKVPFGSYRTNHHNAIRQPLSQPKTTSQVRTKIYTQQLVTQLHPILTQLITSRETRKPRNPRTALVLK